MSNDFIKVRQSLNLSGTVNLFGAKNAALPIMASLILNKGASYLQNIPDLADVNQMITLLQDLGADVFFDKEKNMLKVDSSKINKFEVKPEIMNKMRASILVMGPLLARFGNARVALPGGCRIGKRPIDFHLKGFKKMGVEIEQEGDFFKAYIKDKKHFNSDKRIVLEYPSVGATENLLMLACFKQGKTTIINAAFEPEVLDFIEVLKKMGANVDIEVPCTIKVSGVNKLYSVNHSIIPDRLEAGALLLSAAITGGSIHLPNARPDHMDLFLEKLKEMGHEVTLGDGIKLKATKTPIAVSFKTSPYPGFPTDLQAPMMVAQVVAKGVSCVEETIFENRLLHVKELQKMGAQIEVSGSKATITGVDQLYGFTTFATDIRASCALVLAGLIAQGDSKVMGISHWKRGYQGLENKLAALGANVSVLD